MLTVYWKSFIIDPQIELILITTNLLSIGACLCWKHARSYEHLVWILAIVWHEFLMWNTWGGESELLARTVLEIERRI